MTRYRWLAMLGLGLCVLGALPAASNLAMAESPPASAKYSHPNASPAVHAPIVQRTAPFSWGMTRDRVVEAIRGQIQTEYDDRISKAANPKTQALLEKERDAKKQAINSKVTAFGPGGNPGGYETKTPGEFAYNSNESVIEWVRSLAGGQRWLFFVNDRLYKIYDQIDVARSDGELGDSWTSAVQKLGDALNDRHGRAVSPGTSVPSYFGTTFSVPDLVMWSDGTTLIRLVNLTQRTDAPTKVVALVFEELLSIGNLPTTRHNAAQSGSSPHADPAAGTSNTSRGKKKP
jgi:hypothetical protein